MRKGVEYVGTLSLHGRWGDVGHVIIGDDSTTRLLLDDCHRSNSSDAFPEALIVESDGWVLGSAM